MRDTEYFYKQRLRRTKARRFAETDILAALEAVYHAMQGAALIVEQITAEHRIAFGRRMERIGITERTGEEPYPQEELLNFQLQFIETLEGLFIRTESYLFDIREPENKTLYYAGGGSQWTLFDRLCGWKAINYRETLHLQTERRIEEETQRFRERVIRRLDAQRQQRAGVEEYIWRTQGDDRVRPDHAANDGETFRWDTPPETGHPGAAFGCRCYAEPIPPKHPRYEAPSLAPLLALIPANRARLLITAAIRKAGARLAKYINRKPSPKIPDLKKTDTWPKPPTNKKLKEGIPSRSKPRNRGEKSLYDGDGGEWRYTPGDKYHNPHWDYKPPGKNTEWQNIPIDNLPTNK